ncbi:MAG: hypothetical protein GXP55_14670 [Deltaproteobacteria bacterium]|nr:hypothetical protein [Deltaproteobacteria bacterium]
MEDDSSRIRALAALVAIMAVVGLAHARPHSEQERASARAPAERQPALAARALREGQPLDLNRADQPSLELLPGIGPALAQRIVRSRRRDGPFRQLDDLRRVRGIGMRRLEALRGLLRVVPPSVGSDAGCPNCEDAGQDPLAPEGHGG